MKPNVLFFFTDDQRFDTIGALGDPRVKTPNLDKLAARGTTFKHAHIPGGTSGAVCMPSRAMLHTGRTLFHLQDEGQQIPAVHTTMGQVFQAAGYATFGTGKWHNERAAYARSFTHGDEIFFGGMEDHWNVPAYHFDPTGQYSTQQPIVRDPYYSREVEQRGCDHITAGKHSTELFVDAAVDFLDNRPNDKPFFAYVALMAPHDPRTMPDEFLKMYDPSEIDLPGNFLHQHPIDTGSLRGRDEVLAAIPRDPEEIRVHIAEYFAMISHLDHELGRLLAKLEADGDLDNTLIVFAGDNGLALGQHGLMGKQCLYDHSVRVPLIFAGPGIPKGEESDALVYLLDIFPTLCDLLGIDRPDSVEGQSMAPCLLGESASSREDLYLAYVNTIRGVTDGKHKLIEYACGKTQLFDLETDPLEKENLVYRPKMQSKLEQMRDDLVRHGEAWDDEQHRFGAAFWQARRDLKRVTE